MTEADRFREVLKTIGYQPSDVALFADATHVDSRAFGPLEHLGDCIVDLAIGIAAHRSGESAQYANDLTSNESLDEVFRSELRGRVRARSGDVVEALIGAVHLDGGFDDAARVALRLCGDGMKWTRLGHEYTETLLPPDMDVCPTWLGATAVEALVADAAVQRLGLRNTSQRQLHETRLSVASNDALAAAAVALGVMPAESPIGIAESARALRRAVGATLLACGWRRTAALLMPALPRIV